LAKLLADQDIIVVVAVVYSNPELLQWNRQNLRDYFEIYLKASIGTLEQRDPKGIYKRARAGDMPNVVGIDIPWHAPVGADLVFEQDTPSSSAEMVEQLREYLPTLPI
jgi:adenylylsulfate kinase